MREYRKTETGRKKSLEAIIRYEKRNPEKRRKWVHTWQDRVSARSPRELIALRRSIKRLEKALADAQKRARIGAAGKPSSNDDFEWRN